MNEKDIKKLQRIAELAKILRKRFMILCEKCDKLATDEAGDWSGSSFYCKEHLQKALCNPNKGLFSSNDEYFGELKQDPLAIELYQLLEKL